MVQVGATISLDYNTGDSRFGQAVELKGEEGWIAVSPMQLTSSMRSSIKERRQCVELRGHKGCRNRYGFGPAKLCCESVSKFMSSKEK